MVSVRRKIGKLGNQNSLSLYRDKSGLDNEGQFGQPRDIGLSHSPEIVHILSVHTFRCPKPCRSHVGGCQSLGQPQNSPLNPSSPLQEPVTTARQH